MSEETPTGVRRSNAAPVAMQQSLLELYLKVAHLMAQRGLGNGELRRSLGETAQIDDVHKVIELFEIHRWEWP